jgi:lipid-A-disaccharide synthase
VREILFVAGEASGDLHAAGVARALTGRGAPFRLAGIGGDEMRAAGVELIAHAEQLAVMGFVEVLKHIPLHYRLARELEARIRGGNVALVVLVDYPGFNMKIAAAAHAAGVPVLYYITPQVWAWGAKRLRELARTITKAAVILPFEEALLREHGIDATFVGHPLLDRARAARPRRSAPHARRRRQRTTARAVSGEPRPGDRTPPRSVRRDGARAATPRSRTQGGRERRTARRHLT